MYQARIDSPFGPVLLCGDGAGLSGLYFTDQKDCPPLPDGPPVRPDSRRPGSGTADGVPLRTLRPARRCAAGAGRGLAPMGGEGEAFCQMPLFPEGEAGHSSTNMAFAGSGAAGDPMYSSAFPGSPDGGRGSPAAAGTEGHGRGAATPLEPLQPDTPPEVLALFSRVQAELEQYFAGQRRNFTFPLRLSGTPFQMKVWNALCRVSYGEVASYGELAALAGLTPGHGRAVGMAVGRNPVSIVVPCHRIIGANRMLTGYTGGLERKVGLLRLEGFDFSR